MTSIKVAELLVKRYDLRPPVDIASLLGSVASVEELEWQFEVDGMVTGLSTSPKVFLRSSQPINRKRFTSAHEYGHIQIPWHTESLTCQIDSTQSSFRPVREREANEFASHLLLPRRFLRTVPGKSSNVNDWLSDLDCCEVSAHATFLALRGVLTPGYIFAIEGNDSAPDVMRSPGTVGNRFIPARDEHLALFDKSSLECDRVNFRGRWVRWWRYVEHTPLAVAADRTSKEILDTILNRHGNILVDGKSIRQVIGGIIGGNLRDRSIMSPEQMVGLIIYRFKNNEYAEIRKMADDSELILFVNQKILELNDRDSKSAEKSKKIR